jgi:hypothetical protein
MKVVFEHQKFSSSKELDTSQLIALFKAGEIEIMEDTKPYSTTRRVKILNTIYQLNNLEDYPVLHVFLGNK